MSTENGRDIEPGRGRWERSPQNAHWRDIGISAVAAAARYAAAPLPAVPARNDATPKSAAAPPKIVTLRDLEYLAT